MSRNSICKLLFILLFAGSLYSQRGSAPAGNNTSGPAVEDYSGSYALLIGNSDYSLGWNKLPGVRKDIQALKKVLEEKVGSLEKVRKKALKNLAPRSLPSIIPSPPSAT